MRCVESALGLGGHVVIGVVCLVAQFHHEDAIPCVEFFPSGFLVQLCTCSQTVFCDRQFRLKPNCCTLLHRENGSFEVLCLQEKRGEVWATALSPCEFLYQEVLYLHSPSVTVDRGQL